MDKEKIQQKFVNDFVDKRWRSRALFELNNDKKRWKFIDRMNHPSIYLTKGLISKIPKELTSIEDIMDWTKIDREANCYVISGSGNYDHKIMSFEKAMRNEYRNVSATVIYAYDSNRAYIEKELEFGPTDKFICKTD